MHIPHQLTTNVKLLQKIAIVRHNQAGQVEVLMLQRSDAASSRPGAWDLPGGNSEWPEATTSQANLHLLDVVRELQEETGLQLDKNKLNLSKLTHLSTYFDSDKQIYTMIVGWMSAFADTNQIEIQLSAEHQRFVWATQEQLAEYDFGGAAGGFVLEIINQAFSRFS
jgi:8-oxo-dGTP pyrophosphatase MutT (NUDIX family)